MAQPAVSQTIVDQFSDVRWRLNNLYYIADKDGREVRFTLNWAQERLFNDMDYRNVVLKARQLGFSTFIQVFMLDACLFNSDVSAGTIAHTRDDAEAIFKSKAKYPYDRLPEQIRAANPARQDSARELTFENGSSLRVGTSLRSGTLQYLHISEFGKISAKYPDKAKEIVTGSFNTVGTGNLIFVESTAEGQGGEFHDLCVRAQEVQRQGRSLTPLDFKFHFFPWWQESGYALEPGSVLLTSEHEAYFDGLADRGIRLSDGQKAWYAAMLETQKDEMKREYPSTPEEAFEAAIEGAYYGKIMAKLDTQGRIRSVPHDPALGVETWWDLGYDDATSIWFVQRDGNEFRFIDYYENSGEGLPHYAGVVKKKQSDGDWVYKDHWAPHDGAVHDYDTGKKRSETARDLGVKWEIVPRHELMDGIDRVRNILPLSWFDESKCALGIQHLRSYRKEWDEDRGVFRARPLHNQASHGADAIRTGAMAKPTKWSRRPGQSLAPQVAIV